MLSRHDVARYNFVMHPSWFDRLLVGLHRLLPARLLASFVYLLSRSRRRWLKNALIRVFIRLYNVDLSEAARSDPDDYTTFNDFFSRELRPDARPIPDAPRSLLSPADGTLARFGQVERGTLLQAKGMPFSAAALLADSLAAQKLQGAPYATVYLAPYNYHRVHMPVAGRLLRTSFVPGKLYSVNARTTAVIPNLYALNERLVCEFATDSGPVAVVLVGAMNVASITTAWGGEIFPSGDGRIDRTDYSDAGISLAQGDYLGHFNLGSTVVVIGPPLDCTWDSSLREGSPVRVGMPLGNLAKPS